MNIPTTSARLSPLIATAIFAALAQSCGALSSAADRNDSPRIVVHFEDLNLSSHQGAVALYGRIAAAAGEVCDSYAVDSRDLAAREYVRTCVHKAIADAVVKVGRAELFAVYNAKNHRAAPALVALANDR